MLHHRALAPVIFRDWSEQQVLLESALSALATVREVRTEHGPNSTGTTVGSFDFIRPHPTPSDYLATAVEPAPGLERTQPRPESQPRPWSVSERSYFTPRQCLQVVRGGPVAAPHYCRSHWLMTAMWIVA
ncbi:hypothetical protein AB0M34_37555, partial [Nocardia sp. NPDC050193]